MKLSAIARDPELTNRLAVSARQGPTPSERYAQKLSFIASSLSDENTKVTEQQVDRELAKLRGDGK